MSTTSAFTPANVPNPATDKKDRYCYICEDGGPVVECSICFRAYCYDIMGRTPEIAEDMVASQACVTVPAEIEENEREMFPCPSCLSTVQARTVPYKINRGARRTMRISPRTAVALVVFHLQSLKDLADSLAQQVQAALGVFEINVATELRLLHHGLGESEAEAIHDELNPEVPYHLAVVFLTESHPGGGWWHTSQYGRLAASQVSEAQFLRNCLHEIRKLARDAQTARIFGVACGVNLPGKGVLNAIHNHLVSRRYLSIVLPTSYSLLLCEYLYIFPELFLNLYYFGSELRASLLRVWGKSREVRLHTGLLVMERPNPNSVFSVSKVMHSPLSHRPLGVDLPVASSVCGCPEDLARWNFKTEKQNVRETVFLYRSSCCQVELQVAVFADKRRSFLEHGTTFTEEVWNPVTRTFDFQERAMVRMKHFVSACDPAAAGNANEDIFCKKPHPSGKGWPVLTDVPWTIAGQRAHKP
ncbi:hypothetical protein FS749_015707 [Ceratobasidium sp. UAMH 11750]|nr:hypothetical protein FS749_015707 [Ceratobasidium sp. UAMH 11750]